jgi:hypothetical protein
MLTTLNCVKGLQVVAMVTWVLTTLNVVADSSRHRGRSLRIFTNKTERKEHQGITLAVQNLMH